MGDVGLFVTEVKGWVKLTAAASVTERARASGSSENTAIHARLEGKRRRDERAIFRDIHRPKRPIVNCCCCSKICHRSLKDAVRCGRSFNVNLAKNVLGCVVRGSNWVINQGVILSERISAFQGSANLCKLPLPGSWKHVKYNSKWLPFPLN